MNSRNNLLLFSILSFLLSWCSFSYEFVLIRSVLEIVGDSSFYKHFLTGMFILGLGSGTIYIDKNKFDLTHLIKIEKKIVLIGLFSAILLLLFDNISSYLFTWEMNLLHYQGHNLFQLKEDLVLYKIFFLFSSSLLSLIIGYYSGQELPLLIKEHQRVSKERTGFLLAINYFGSLIASLVTLFYLSNNKTPQEILIYISSINLFVLLFLLKRSVFIKTIYVMSFLTVSYFSLTIYNNNLQISLKTKYSKGRITNIKDIFINKKNMMDIARNYTPYQVIDLQDNGDDFSLYLNGQLQFNSNNEEKYHQIMTHVPMSINKGYKILLLGGGDGLILRELFKYKNKEITHVELDKRFIEYCLNNEKISQLNNKSLNKKVNLYYNDAFSFMKKNKIKFDVIIVDFPYPYFYDISKLYSVEFYSYLKKGLQRDGVIMMDLPLERNAYLQYSKSFIKTNTIMKNSINSVFKYNKLFTIGTEGFAILSNKEIILKSKKRSVHFTLLKKEDLSFIDNNLISIDKENQEVNSIYKPKILEFSNYKH